MLTLVLIPAVLWLASFLWQRAERNRVDHEELERAQTQLLETLTTRMETFVTLRTDLRKATTTLGRHCVASGNSGGRPAVAACGDQYDSALTAVDQAIVDLAWRVDSLPIVSESTYTVLTALKTTFWKSCEDDQAPLECGYRQRAIRLIHGFGLGPEKASSLKSCLDEREEEPPCKNTAALMRTLVLGPIDIDANVFFCLVAADIKNTRVSAFKRRSTAIGGDETLRVLIDRLERNVKSSSCTAIVDTWNREHPATPIGSLSR